MDTTGEVPHTIEDDLLGFIPQTTGPKRPSIRQLNDAVHRELDNDFGGLWEQLDKFLDKREWIEDSAVILIQEQECLSCGSQNRWSQGWFTGQHHARDKTARRLVAGKPLTYFPVVVERVTYPPVQACGNCAESHATIERIVREKVTI